MKTNLRLHIVLLVILMSMTTAFAQKLHIEIKDIETGEKLPYATLTIDKNHNVVSNANGIAEVDARMAGKRAEAQCVGFKNKVFVLTGQHRQVILLEPLSHTISEVVVSGKNKPNSLTANSVSLSPSDLSHNQQSSLAALINRLPGVRMLSTGLVEKPIIEGMSGSRIAIINNDNKLTGQHWGDDHAPEISIPSFAQVSVVKGAESVKYGSNAIGGIVNISSELDLTRTSPIISLNTNYTNNGREYGGDGYLEQSIGKTKSMRYRLSGKYYRSGDYSTADYLLNNTGSRIINATADFAWSHGAWRYDFHASEYNAKLGIFSGSHIGNYTDLMERFKVGRPHQEYIKPFTYDIDVPYQAVNHVTVGNSLTYTPNDQNHVTFRYAWQSDHRREFDYRKGTNVGKPSFAFVLNSHYLNANWKHSFGDMGMTSELGASILLINNRSDKGTNTTPIIPNYVSRESGLYGFLTVQPNQKWTFEGGIRADQKYVNSAGYSIVAVKYGGPRNFFSVSGILGTKAQFTPHLTWQANIGLAWRAPEVNELYSHGVHHGEALYVVGDRNLNTEKALKFTTQMEYKLPRLTIKGSAFVSRIFDYIYDIPRYTTDAHGHKELETENWISGIFPVFYYKQSQGIFVGGDITADWDIIDNLTWRMQGEWMWAKDLKTHSYFPNIPANRYTSYLNYHHHINKDWHYSVNIGAKWVDKQRYFDPDVDLLPESPPGYFLLNGGGSIEYHLPKNMGTIQWYLSSDNLLNKLYKDYNNRMRYFAHDKGRSITIGLKYSF